MDEPNKQAAYQQAYDISGPAREHQEQAKTFGRTEPPPKGMETETQVNPDFAHDAQRMPPQLDREGTGEYAAMHEAKRQESMKDNAHRYLGQQKDGSLTFQNERGKNEPEIEK